MKALYLPPSVRAAVRTSFYAGGIGVMLGFYVTVRWAEWAAPGANVWQQMRDRGGLALYFGPLIGVLVLALLTRAVTREPREEPDWEAIAMRHMGTARALVIGGACLFMLCAGFLIVTTVLHSLSVSLRIVPPAVAIAALVAAAFGFVLVAVGKRIERAASEDEADRRDRSQDE